MYMSAFSWKTIYPGCFLGIGDWRILLLICACFLRELCPSIIIPLLPCSILLLLQFLLETLPIPLEFPHMIIWGEVMGIIIIVHDMIHRGFVFQHTIVNEIKTLPSSITYFLPSSILNSLTRIRNWLGILYRSKIDFFKMAQTGKLRQVFGHQITNFGCQKFTLLLWIEKKWPLVNNVSFVLIGDRSWLSGNLY